MDFVILLSKRMYVLIIFHCNKREKHSHKSIKKNQMMIMTSQFNCVGSMIVLILFLSIFFWFIRKLFKSNRLDENYRYDNVNYNESYREQLSNQRHSTVLVEKSTIHGYIIENLDGVEIIFSLKEV